MFHRKVLVPKQFESFVHEHPTDGMPGEHAFQFQLPFIKDNEESQWQRVWVVTDLQTEFADIEIALDPLDTLERCRKHQMHKFKIDIVRYLRVTKQQLTLKNDQLYLELQST